MAVTDPQSTNAMPVAGHDGTNFRTVKTDTSGRVIVGGDAADDAAASGNPVLIGARYEATPDAVDAGDGGYLAMSIRRALHVQLYDSANNVVIQAAADNADGVAVSGTANRLKALAQGLRFNGTTWDREYGNSDVTALASAARTGTLNSGDLTNYNGRGLHVVLDVVNAGTGSITLTIQGKDALSGQYYTLLAGAAVTTVVANVYRVYPGLTAAANAVASDILPRTYRILVTHNNANSITYSVGASIIL